MCLNSLPNMVIVFLTCSNLFIFRTNKLQKHISYIYPWCVFIAQVLVERKKSGNAIYCRVIWESAFQFEQGKVIHK